MKIGTYESTIWEQNSKNLVFAAWSDNAIVKTLSNYHGATILDAENGLMRQGKDKNKKREMKQKPNYCETLHLIDKGNGAEAKYDMAGKEPVPQLGPKACVPPLQHGDEQRLCHVQRVGCEGRWGSDAHGEINEGADTCIVPARREHETQCSDASAHLRDMNRVDGHAKGQRFEGQKVGGDDVSPKSTVAISRKGQLVRQQKAMVAIHLPMPTAMRGSAAGQDALGSKIANSESNVYLCHSVKNGEVVSCHIAYHKRNHNTVFKSDG
ncbi:hypothetical protein ACHAW5_007512 [Stephanodiscus triporus]|uniref:PiggyBac transposable element-derived protein domain-containing protein n=1 Tax=Stephanodiscus triporus TaxID=2934178 RepID=A0ABD3NGP6_9STRA